MLSSSAYEFDRVEEATRADFEEVKVNLKVCAKDDSSGTPVPSPSLTLTRWSGGIETITIGPTAKEGCFDLTCIPRGAVQVKIEAPDYYTSVTPIDLHISTGVINVVTVEDVQMTKKRDGVARLVFGGDVMFERRFFDESLLTSWRHS